MPKYIKQEMNNLNQKSKKKCYYRLEKAETVSTDEFIEIIAHPGSGVSKGTVKQVLSTFITQLSTVLAKGNRVDIEGLGRFRAAIGVREDKVMDSIDGNEVKRNSVSIEVNRINFHADKELINSTNKKCMLKRGNVERLHVSPYTEKERLQMAISFMSQPQHRVMRIADYMNITKLSRTKAQQELVSFRRNPLSGLTSIGSGTHLGYTLSS